MFRTPNDAILVMLRTLVSQYSTNNCTGGGSSCEKINYSSWAKSVSNTGFIIWLISYLGKILIFTYSGQRQSSRRWKVLLKSDFKTVNAVLSQTFNHKIYFEYVICSQAKVTAASHSSFLHFSRSCASFFFKPRSLMSLSTTSLNVVLGCTWWLGGMNWGD